MLFTHYRDLLVVGAPAKLNLSLEILSRRADGYHELQSLMVMVRLYDTLSFANDPTGRIVFHCRPAGAGPPSGSPGRANIPAGDENLVVRAAELLRERTGCRRGARITLHKRIPAAAGLGGGSSDAAATLRALDRLWELHLPDEELARLASQLGSDVPFFLCRSAAAVARGRGEQIEPVQIPLGLHFVIACPATGLSTALVYRHCRPAERPRSVGRLVDALRQSRLRRAAGLMHNDLQSPAEELNPEIRGLIDRFSTLPVAARSMTGSGSACFGLCANRRQAARIASRLRAERLGRIFVAQSGA